MPPVVAALPPAQAPAPPPGQPPAQPVPTREVVTPSFDLVRVEPNGESVIAGRGAPGATVEMLRDGQVHARAVADGSGLFAFVPPPLLPGSHQIILQSNAPDGTRQRSRDSVTVAVSESRNTPPLVALTAPDRPTVILSNPEPPAQGTARADAPAGQGGSPSAGARPQQQASLPPASQAAPRRPEARIVSVEAEEGGRLFVSGEAAPGATVRLYLNETMIAPGGVGADGRVSFAIGRGIRPGDYRVRIDEVDPVSGSVKSRAEVAFNVPPAVEVPLPPHASSATTPPPLPPPAPRAVPQTVAAPRPVETPAAPASPPSSQVAAAPTEPSRPGPSPASPAVVPPTPAPAPAVVTSIPPAAAPPSGAPTAAPSAGQTAAATPNQAQRGAPAAPSAPASSPREDASPAGSPAEPARRDQAASAPEPRDLPPGTIVIPDLNTAIVSRGDNLWRISQRVYGRGVRYTVIYGANQPQIRNPNLIYPGQVFVLPLEQQPQVQ